MPLKTLAHIQKYNKLNSTSGKKPRVSVIIPTYNSSKTLDLCLQSLMTQNYTNLEIIVVDNYSTDSTRKIASKFGVLILDGGDPSLARNIGVKNTTSNYILFIDSDEILEKNLVNECVLLCEEYTECFVKIPLFAFGNSFIGKCSAFWKNKLSEVDREIRGSMASDTVCRFFLRKHVILAGYFDESLRVGEDVSFKKALVATGLFGIRSISCIRHLEPSNLKTFVIKNSSYAQFMFSNYEKHNILVSDVFQMAILALKKSIRNFLTEPKLLIGCCLLLLIKTYLITLAFTSSKISRIIYALNKLRMRV